MDFFPLLDGLPSVDPIPLPAPVWLMKGLLWLTSAAHFLSVQLMIGGLVTALLWSFKAKGVADNSLMAEGSRYLGHRLPILMALLINLGVPPLLFTQVLYGQALYTSSVLIGAFWIAVIPLLILGYWSLYWTNMRSDKQRDWRWTSLLAFVCVAAIGFIYANNFTLMLQPDKWNAMYEADPAGVQLNTGDTTMWLRYAFMLSAGGVSGGIGIALLSTRKSLGEGLRNLLCKAGGSCAMTFTLPTLLLGVGVWAVQPDAVKPGISDSTLATIGGGIFILGVLATGAIGFMLRKDENPRTTLLAWLGALTVVLQVAGSVLYRDVIRDATLALVKFDVWARTEVPNWSVLIAFLLLLVVGLGFIGWMIKVIANARPEEEVTYAG